MMASHSAKPILTHLFGNGNGLKLYWNLFSSVLLILGDYANNSGSWQNIEIQVAKISIQQISGC